ncbi:MAG TPA: glycosyltransferase family 9 protein [Myxococcota bacterium]|nr:glycosyltransferase family 9 protein [Myxococcota bacterium]
MLEPIPAKRILVIRLGALGDVVRTRFAFAGLRELWPAAQIDWLVEDRAAAGLVGLPGLSQRVEVPRRRLRARHPWVALATLREFARELRSRDYDLSIDFHGVLRSAFLAWSARIPVRVGYAAPIAKEGSHWLQTTSAPVEARHVSRFERNAALVRFLGGAVPAQPHVLELDPAREQLFAGLPARFALVHPGTSPKTGYKRWEADRFAAVARELFTRAGVETRVAFGPVAGEREAARAVVAAAGGAAELAPPTESLAEFLALLRRASLFVGCDSGPMHLASLAGTPVVAIFGPTDPVENAPSATIPHRIVRVDVGCNPCREGCPARACMRAVEPEAVSQAALALLDGPARGI